MYKRQGVLSNVGMTKQGMFIIPVELPGKSRYRLHFLFTLNWQFSSQISSVVYFNGTLVYFFFSIDAAINTVPIAFKTKSVA